MSLPAAPLRILPADAIDSAVRSVIDQGYRTGDLATGAAGEIRVNTAEMGNAVVAAL